MFYEVCTSHPQTYASLGRYREAIENVHIAISLDPNPESATESDAAEVDTFVLSATKYTEETIKLIYVVRSVG